MSDGALSIAVAALQQIAQHGSEERDRVTARAALDCIDALGEAPRERLIERDRLLQALAAVTRQRDEFERRLRETEGLAMTGAPAAVREQEA